MIGWILENRWEIINGVIAAIPILLGGGLGFRKYKEHHDAFAGDTSDENSEYEFGENGAVRKKQ